MRAPEKLLAAHEAGDHAGEGYDGRCQLCRDAAPPCVCGGPPTCPCPEAERENRSNFLPLHAAGALAVATVAELRGVRS